MRKPLQQFWACTRIASETPRFPYSVSEMPDSDWKLRNEFWLSSGPVLALRKRRERSTETLVLCGHGISLRIENRSLAIKNGFTHFPQERETFRYFRGDLDRPARIIVLDGSGHLTFDVLDWLAEQDVPLIRVSWTGDVITVAGGSGYSADREKVVWQRETRADAKRQTAFGAALIAKKIENSLITLQSMPQSGAHNRAFEVADGALAKLRDTPPTTMSELHGIEGSAAAAYFEAWQGVSLPWQTAARRPVPDAWRTLGPRGSMRAGKRSKNRNATHPINAMLNYAYAVTVGHLKIQALASGYDPTLGIIHQNEDAPAYALDLIEPMRPLIDCAVLNFALRHELHPSDFVIRADGACRLNPQMAQRVILLSTATIVK